MIIIVTFLLISLSISPAVNSVELDKKINNKNENNLNSSGIEYYAILAACANYDDASSNLPIGEYKLKKIYRGLISNDNWKDENIILLVNDNPDPTNPGYEGGATKANIVKALGEMAQKVGKNDVFVFSWQGHGSEVPESETSGTNDDYETDGYDEVICPWDCTRENDGTLINYITDDELDSYFSKIKCEGMLLIFESCFSGGLVGNSIGDKIFGNDVDGPGRIVIVSTLDGTLGRASWIYGFPMTWTIGDAFDQNSIFRGPVDENSITAEDAFTWARPQIFAKNSIIWVGIWTYFFIVEYEFQRQENGLDIDAAIAAALSATFWVFFEFCYVQLLAMLESGGSGMFNWPHMVDKYPLIGNKKLTIVDNAGESNAKAESVDIPLMPEIWLKPDYDDYLSDFSELISEEDYEQMSWFDWNEIDKDLWPKLQAKAEYNNDNSDKRKIAFSAEASNGPREFIYNWNFGDGITSNEQNPIHSYEQNGEYDVKLTVTDNEGRIVEQIFDDLKVVKNKIKVVDLLQRYPFLQKFLSFFIIFS